MGLSRFQGHVEDRGSMESLTLRSTMFSNTRTIRVWLPPGYSNPDQRHRTYPVFYFTDGVAAFHGRELDKVAAKLVAAGKIPPTIFVGIDNGGSTRESKNPSSDRANEYLPYPDSSLEPPVPEPHGKLFPQFLETEVRPFVESHYRTNGDVGLAGASYGGAIAIYTVMENPGRSGLTERDRNDETLASCRADADGKCGGRRRVDGPGAADRLRSRQHGRARSGRQTLLPAGLWRLRRCAASIPWPRSRQPRPWRRLAFVLRRFLVANRYPLRAIALW